MRVRWNTNTDTPLPPDVPAGKNPPDGAVLDYLVGQNASGEVTLTILDGANHVVRKYSSSDPVPEVDPQLAIPRYWVRPPQHLSNEPGLHRFLWDMHYTPLPLKHEEYPMTAVFEDTAPMLDAPWVMPGRYTVQLTVGGQTYRRFLTVKMDPRVHTSEAGLLQQFTLSKQVYDDLLAGTNAVAGIRGYRAQLGERMKTAQGDNEKLVDHEKEAQALEGEAPSRGNRFAAPGADSFSTVNGTLTALLQGLQEADVAPTAQTVAAIRERRAALAKLMQRWATLKTQSQ